MDWKAIFVKYVERVGDAEGVYFLYRRDWSEEERKAIEEAMGATDEWSPFGPPGWAD